MNHMNDPGAIIIGEPTSMRVVVTHKGIYSFETVFNGIEAHSSLTHRAVNALSYAAKTIAWLDDYQEKLIADIDHHNKRFEPHYTTINAGILEGGTATNIVPNKALLKWHFRYIPGFDAEAMKADYEAFLKRLEAEMKARDKNCSIENIQSANMPAFNMSTGPEAEDFIGKILRLAEENETLAVSYGTEAGHLQKLDLPIVICGPGAIDQAHKPDEFVEIFQLKRCTQFLEKLAQSLC